MEECLHSKTTCCALQTAERFHLRHFSPGFIEPQQPQKQLIKMPLATNCIVSMSGLLFGLGFAVSLARNAKKTAGIVQPNPTDILYKLQRAHANTAEYVPILSLLMYLLHVRKAAVPVWVDYLMIATTASRFMIAAGIVATPDLNKAPHILRIIGAWGTYIGGAGLTYAVYDAY